jgi:NADH:ubiquinone oxidoreductase subunit 6 (subunit J)
MDLPSLSPTQRAAGQILLAAVLAVAAFALLLPRPRGRSVTGGIAAAVAAAAVFGAWLASTYDEPTPERVGSVLFWLFSAGALGFGTVLVVQRNPARGAIAFAFVILSTCGLFLLLAAPFLMAVTIIVYAGAIIVTFLFVLMLSQVQGPSDENDRSREPLFGAFAGFAFVGLVLFTVYLSALGNTAHTGENANDPPKAEQKLPAPVLTPEERATLLDAVAKLDAADEQLRFETGGREARASYFDGIQESIAGVVGSNNRSTAGSIRLRLEKVPRKPGEKLVPLREDQRAKAVLRQAATVREWNEWAAAAAEGHIIEGKPDAEAVKAQLRTLRDETLLLAGSGELPARNVANLGFLLYSEHLLAVELAGTLLLVATIGAVAIAHREGAGT